MTEVPTIDQVIDEALNHPGVKFPANYFTQAELRARIEERDVPLEVYTQQRYGRSYLCLVNKEWKRT